jgi:hypothetical protein
MDGLDFLIAFGVWTMFGLACLSLMEDHPKNIREPIKRGFIFGIIFAFHIVISFMFAVFAFMTSFYKSMKFYTLGLLGEDIE